MAQVDDLSLSLVALDQDSTLIAVIEMGLNAWLVAGLVPGVRRQPLKKIEPEPAALLRVLRRWREEAVKAGGAIRRIAVAFEAGRDGFWLARLLRREGVEAHVIHPTSVAVSREHRRAKTDRLDTQHLMRAFLGWLRGEPKHCQMAALPSLEEEDARLPGRERETLVKERTRIVNRIKSVLIRFGLRSFKPLLRNAEARLAALRLPEGGPLPANTLCLLKRELERLRLTQGQIRTIEAQRAAEVAAAKAAAARGERSRREAAMLYLLTRIVGLAVETAQTLTHEIFARRLRDRRAVARYAGLSGAPDESGKRRREKGLARAGNLRVRKCMIQLAWRFTRLQKQSALAQWFFARAAAAKTLRKTLIIALARKLLIALWRYVELGVLPEGVALRAA
jgi:transposase